MQKLHFETDPFAGSKTGALYGQTNVQYLHPMHVSLSTITAPVAGSFAYARVGHPLRQTGVWQWLQAMEMLTRTVSGQRPPSITPTFRQAVSGGRAFFSLQAAAQEWHPMQFAALK
jgi:hypothetical protein